MKKTRKVLYNVQCAFAKKHIFEKVFEVEEGTEQVESEVEAYCPFCNNMVEIRVKGKAAIDESILKKFAED